MEMAMAQSAKYLNLWPRSMEMGQNSVLLENSSCSWMFILLSYLQFLIHREMGKIVMISTMEFEPESCDQVINPMFGSSSVAHGTSPAEKSLEDEDVKMLEPLPENPKLGIFRADVYRKGRCQQLRPFPDLFFKQFGKTLNKWSKPSRFDACVC